MKREAEHLPRGQGSVSPNHLRKSSSTSDCQRRLSSQDSSKDALKKASMRSSQREGFPCLRPPQWPIATCKVCWCQRGLHSWASLAKWGVLRAARAAALK